MVETYAVTGHAASPFAPLRSHERSGAERGVAAGGVEIGAGLFHEELHLPRGEFGIGQEPEGGDAAAGERVALLAHDESQAYQSHWELLSQSNRSGGWF